MIKEKYRKLLKYSAQLVLILSATTQFLVAQNDLEYFNFNPISKTEFEEAYVNQFNAEFTTILEDSSKLKRAFKLLDSTYNDEEKELAKDELINPRDLTTFRGYYPEQDAMLFFIQDYHYEKACFILPQANEMFANARFYGSYGVMSKDGIWIGFKRNNCDNFLQMELCKVTKSAIIPLYFFDFKKIDINGYEEENEIPTIFWARKNTVYISAYKYEDMEKVNQYYSLEFGY